MLIALQVFIWLTLTLLILQRYTFSLLNWVLLKLLGQNFDKITPKINYLALKHLYQLRIILVFIFKFVWFYLNHSFVVFHSMHFCPKVLHQFLCFRMRINMPCELSRKFQIYSQINHLFWRLLTVLEILALGLFYKFLHIIDFVLHNLKQSQT